MVTSERRTRGDLVAVASIVVAVVAAASLLWRYSDARATVSEPAVGIAPAVLSPPAALPPSLAEVWSAPSGATVAPVVAANTVVTADGREVIGRDPLTGERRWRYARDIDLCTTVAAWSNAVTVWSKDSRYCSEVTAIGGDSGKRTNQRNGDAERGTRVLFDGTHATATGGRYLEAWRSDLVRTTQYGAVRATVNPGKQPRSGCEYRSIAAAASQIGIVERCPDDGDRADRLTVLRVNPKDAEQPEPLFSVQLGAPAALVVAMNGQRTAVLLPGPNRLAVFDEKGNQLSSSRVDVPLPGAGGPAIADTLAGPGAVYWFAGSATIALDPAELRPLWTVGGTAGTGVLYAGRLLVPGPGEVAVLDAVTGRRLGSTPVDRGGYTGPVRLGAAGTVLLEQRGGTLVALR